MINIDTNHDVSDALSTDSCRREGVWPILWWAVTREDPDRKQHGQHPVSQWQLRRESRLETHLHLHRSETGQFISSIFILFVYVVAELKILLSSGSECSPPVAPLNGHLEPLQSNYIFKDHITLTCDPGYSLRQVRQRTHFTCADKGSDCYKLIETNPYCFTSHSHSLLQGDNEFEHYQIECQRDGKWSSDFPLCKSKFFNRDCNSGFLLSFFSHLPFLSFLLLLLLAATREGISKEASFPTKHFNQSDTELKL